MNAALACDGLQAPARPGARLAARGAEVEAAVLALALLALIGLPLVASLLRALGIGALPGAAGAAQHMVLLVGLLGATLAAARGRLLALATGTLLERLGAGRRTAILRAALAVAVCAGLAAGGLQFAASEHAAASRLAGGMPLWPLLLLPPAAFALIGWRLLLGAGPGLGTRLATLALAALPVIAAALPLAPEGWLWPGLLGVAVATLLGAPLFIAIGGSALVLFLAADLPLAALALDHYGLVVNPTLAAIPLFSAAGFLFAEGAAPGRLVQVFQATLGHLRGGAALVSVIALAFFTCLTGASGVAILALGGLLLPLLLAGGYTRRGALGLVTAGGAAGVLVPPSMPLILFAVVAQVGLEQMFRASLLPALLMLGLTLAWGFVLVRRGAGAQPAAVRPALGPALWRAKWELGLPVVALVGLFGGFATPVEAAALTAGYALLVRTAVQRELHWRRDLPRVLGECGMLVGGVLLILGVAQGLTNYLVDARVPEHALDLVGALITSPWVFLLALNGVLLLAGCLMDIFSAIVVLTPLLLPLGQAYGIDPLHLGVLMLANLELGYLTPPVGLNLFFAAQRFGEPLLGIARAMLTLFPLLLLGLLVITFVPWLSLALAGG